MVKRKLKEAEEEKISVMESEEIMTALDDLKETLTNAEKLEITEEEIDFSGAVDKVIEALEDLDIEHKDKVIESLECMKEEDHMMTQEEIKDFVAECDMVKEEIENLDKEEIKEEAEAEAEEVKEEEEETLEESEEALVEAEEIKEEAEAEAEEVKEEEEETLEESVNRIFGKLELAEDTKFAIRTLIEAKIKEEEEKVIDDLQVKCEEYAEELRKEAEAELAEEVEELNKKADSYLSHVAEEWAEENKLAIKEGLKVQIAENFINGLKKLLEENDIEIDDEKEDLVQETVEKCEKLQDKLDEVLADKAELQEQVKVLNRYKMIQESTRELTQVQRDRLSKLLEGFSYTDEAELASRIKVLKENYIAVAKPEVLNEQVSKKVAKVSAVDNDIEAYASFINRG